jgi:hypothetical protein
MSLILAACQASVPQSGPSGSPMLTAAPTPSFSDEPAPSVTPAPEPQPAAWTELAFDGRVVSVRAGPDGFVAVGADSAEGAPTAWTSPDGTTWSAHEVPDPNAALREEGFVGSVMGQLARWGDTTFSFGTIVGAADGRGVIAWRSRDGTAWEVIESQSELFRDGYFVGRLIAHDDGLVAIEHRFAQYTDRIWTWTPATSWMVGPFSDPNDLSSRTLLNDIAWDGQRFVAVGGPYSGDHEAQPVGGVWVSSDAQTWAAAAPAELAEATLERVVPIAGGGFLVTGTIAEGPMAWRSTDGNDWQAVDLPTDPGVEGIRVFATDEALLALGFAPDRTLVWRSLDGVG